MVLGLRMLSGKLRDLEFTIDFFSYSVHDTFECQDPPPFKTLKCTHARPCLLLYDFCIYLFFWLIKVFLYFVTLLLILGPAVTNWPLSCCSFLAIYLLLFFLILLL